MSLSEEPIQHRPEGIWLLLCDGGRAVEAIDGWH